jgi:peptidoglycan hydrolase-like amidase
MIDAAQVEKSIDWMRDNAEPAAQARANRVYLEQYLKVVKAELMQAQPEMSVAAAEVQALASPKYKETLLAYKQAITEDETFRFLYTTREARVEAWRTQEASLRAMTK